MAYLYFYEEEKKEDISFYLNCEKTTLKVGEFIAILAGTIPDKNVDISWSSNNNDNG